MIKYTEILEFFIENGISLDKDQLGSLYNICNEGFFDKFKKNKNILSNEGIEALGLNITKPSTKPINKNKLSRVPEKKKYNESQMQEIKKITNKIINKSNSLLKKYMQDPKYKKEILDYMRNCDISEKEFPSKAYFEIFEGPSSDGYLVLSTTEPKSKYGLDQDINIAFGSIREEIANQLENDKELSSKAEIQVGTGDGDEGCLYIYIYLYDNMNESTEVLTEGLFTSKKKKKAQDIKKFRKMAMESIDPKSQYYGDFGYNYAEVAGVILALKFMNIPEDTIKKALKADTENRLTFKKYLDISGNEVENELDPDQEICIIYADEDAPFYNMKDGKIYHYVNGKIEPTSFYSLIGDYWQSIYFNKDEFENLSL